jgi:hypothetical protein
MVFLASAPSLCSGLRTTLRLKIVGVAGLVACRIGGPTADPNGYVAFPDGAAEGASPAPMDDAATVSSGDDGDDSVGGDANDSSTSVSSGDGGNTGDGPASVTTTDGGACSRTVAVCDPVHNTGCNSLQQCDVDPYQTTTPTGLCVFASPAEGSPCLSTIFTESCRAGFTCVSGNCRALCFCNADCPTGQCCSDTSGPPAFSLCSPCP